jgi:hypothetical protein
MAHGFPERRLSTRCNSAEPGDNGRHKPELEKLRAPTIIARDLFPLISRLIG